MIGRGLALPSGLSAELTAGEWRLADAPGIDQRRARATLRDDLDQLEEEAHDYSGRFKISVAGPWTLAATVGVAHTGRVLADVGARRDLAQSVAHGVGELLADLGHRLPSATFVLQVDEPLLPSVFAGAVPTPGGYFRHRAVDLPELTRALGWITAEPARLKLAVPAVLHSCAPWLDGWPALDLVSGHASSAGFDALSFDLDQLGTSDWDALAAAFDTGAGLYVGCLPTLGPELPIGVDVVRRRALTALERLGVSGPSDRVVLTPSCGLAGWTPAQASAAFGVLAKAATQVAEELGEG